MALLHGFQGGDVGFGGHTGAAGRIDGKFGTVIDPGLDEKGVGDNADVGAETDELDFEFTLEPADFAGENVGTESGLVDVGDRHLGLIERLLDVLIELPTGGAVHTVDDREVLSLVGLHVVVRMGVPGGENVLAVEVLDFLDDVLDSFLCYRVRKCAVNEIILCINDNENLGFHI